MGYKSFPMASEYEPATMGRSRGWIHQCGNVDWWPIGQAPADGGCDGCESGSNDASDWRPLYVDAAHKRNYDVPPENIGQPIDFAGPTGRELPGEHWNARIIRETVEAAHKARLRHGSDA